MTVQTLVPTADRQATIVCEHCGTTTLAPTAALRAFAQPRKVRCRCGATFFVRLEHRKFSRKHARLDGEYSMADASQPTGAAHGPMVVENLSRTGIGFRTVLAHNIQMNAVIVVHFILDDTQKTGLRKSAVVRHVDAQYIGAEFLDFDSYRHGNRVLGVYLLPT